MRPWKIPPQHFDTLRKWLTERSGIAVYENHMLDSSAAGERSMLPLPFIDSDGNIHTAAPPRIGDVPSRMKELVDTITINEFADVDTAMAACFELENSNS